jgi:Zn-dependent M28 family amino/carboxypeptidase
MMHSKTSLGSLRWNVPAMKKGRARSTRRSLIFRQPANAGGWLCSLLVFALTLHAVPASAAAPAPLKAAAESIRSEDLLRHIKVLASDDFEGRGPGTRGEDISVRYLVEQFKNTGLKPGHPDGTFIQKVPLMGVTAASSVNIQVAGKPLALALPGDCIATSLRFEPEIKVSDSEVIFVGYGIEAPEYGWDDYKDVDVRGKTIMMLVNDPPIPDPNDSSNLDEKMFQGRAMTYYGRWTYKYEIAAKKGAAAALIVHETGPAGYPYFVLVASHARENFDLQSPDKNAGRVPVQGWLTESKARELCRGAGHDFSALKQSALKKDFRPMPLGARASFVIRNQLREVASQNVVGKIEGSDPKLKDEFVVFTAHWDHIGRNEKLAGDQIFNGALDNASGTAGLLELAEAFARLRVAPKRTVLFLAVTAEEKGLLGAKYYVEHPLHPLERTLANLNMDGINPWGRTRDVEVIGHGNSTLEDLLGAAAAGQGRTIKPDSGPEKGRYFRSDHFEFAKLGVPGLYLKSGVDYVGKPPGFGKQKTDEYTERDYHKVTDEIKPDWDMSGGVEDLRLLLEVGWRVAESSQWPEWKPGSEFKARRDESLRNARPGRSL